MKPKSYPVTPLALSVVAAAVTLTQSALADYVWTGAAGNGLYSDPANWSGTSTDNNLIDNGQTATVDSVIGWNPNDLKIASAGGSLGNTTTGTVTISAGSLSTNYWTFVGDWAGNATMNVTGTGSYTSGALNGNGNILVGLYGSTGVLNVNTTGTLTASGLYISPNNTTNGGALPNSGGTFNLAAGTVNISGDTQIGSDFWGAGNYSNGTMTMTGGTMNVGGLFEVGHLGLSATSGTSSATISGGTLNVQNDLRLGFAGNTGTTASMVINGGAVNVATATARWVILGQWDPTSSNMEVSNGGSLNLNAGTDIMFGTSGNSGTRTLTVDGGTINGTAGGGTYIDMQRGTSAGTSTITIKNGGTIAVDAIVGGGVSTLNFDGGTLKATSSDANLINISGGGTTNLLAGGATIDTNGYNPTVVSGLGGSGGLTKDGAGVLTLSGTSTYTGATIVSAGTLLVTGALGNTAVTVQSGATIAGSGTLAGTLAFEDGAMLDTTAGTITVTGLVQLGTATDHFDFGNLAGFDVNSAAPGTYTFLSGSNIDFTYVDNFGLENALALSGGRSAYFQNGSLQVVVIPEPGAALLGGIGVLALLRRRRGC